MNEAFRLGNCTAFDLVSGRALETVEIEIARMLNLVER